MQAKSNVPARTFRMRSSKNSTVMRMPRDAEMLLVSNRTTEQEEKRELLTYRFRFLAAPRRCDVDCGLGQTCQWINGEEMCVCSEESCRATDSSSSLTDAQPICASNNMTFRSECAMAAWKCINQQSALYKKYDGQCQSKHEADWNKAVRWASLSLSCVEDCRSVKCPEDTACLLVKNTGEPFCYPKKHCDSTANPEPVCGTNGVTYPNVCVMRLSADAPGRTPELAHKGHCGKYCPLVHPSFSFTLNQSFPRKKMSSELVSALRTLCLLSSISAGLHRLSIFSSILRAQRRMQYEYCDLWWRWLFVQELLCLITWPVWQKSLY